MRIYAAFLAVWVLVVAHPLSAQIDISGSVHDDLHRPLMYVNIGIPGRNPGTISDAGGHFRLTIPYAHSTDTLRFSMAGYSPQNIAVSTLEYGRELTIEMKLVPTELKPVKVSASRLRERNFGKARIAPLLHFSDGSILQNDIFEIGKLVRLGDAAARIKTVSLYINESRKDSATFRIRFYRYDGTGPAASLLQREVVQRKAVREGWLSFDLANQAIRLRGNVIAAIEFLPDPGVQTPVSYGIIPGGSNNVVRQHSQGNWTTPPHRFRMFVTALVPVGRGKDDCNPDDETEAIPAFRMWSDSVRDSFHIFVHLPAGYATDSARPYPVAYLLDANFYSDALGRAMRKDRLENHIVIGIGYRDFLQMDSLRNRDYTYPEAPPADSFYVSGGADRFLLFLQEDLLPEIDSRYRTDTSDRTLMGHSLGGYFTLYALSRDNPPRPAFHHFVAASPSLHYHDHYLLRSPQGLHRAASRASGSVLVAMGALEDAGDGTPGMQLQALDSAAGILRKMLPGMQVRTKVYPGLTHMQTGVPCFIDGLRRK